jgi:hypothetical protein
MLRAFSVSDALFAARSKETSTSDVRIGVMAAVDNLAQLRQAFPSLLERFPYRQQPTGSDSGDDDNGPSEAMDVINVAIRPSSDAPDDDRTLRRVLMPFVEVWLQAPHAFVVVGAGSPLRWRTGSENVAARPLDPQVDLPGRAAQVHAGLLYLPRALGLSGGSCHPVRPYARICVCACGCGCGLPIWRV